MWVSKKPNYKKISQILWLVKFLWPFFLKDEQKSGKIGFKLKIQESDWSTFVEIVKSYQLKKFSQILWLVMFLWPFFFKDKQKFGKKGFKLKNKIWQSDWSTFLWKLSRAADSNKFSQILWLVMFLRPIFFKDEQKSEKKRV